MWNLLAGYSGLTSLCQPAFLGLAGYTVVMFTWNNLPFYLGVITSAIVAAIFALVISIPVFRMKGIYFAIATLILPEALKTVFLIWRPVGQVIHGKGAGYVIKGLENLTRADVYWMSIAVGIGSIIIMYFILRSKFGLALAAIRDNDNTAESAGVDVFKTKLLSFVISAAVTATAGSIFYIHQKYIEPISAFNISWTMIALLGTVIGGIGIEWGPIVGSAIVVILHFVLARYAGLSLLIQGIILVGIMLLAPQGILGALYRLRTSRTFRHLFQGRNHQKPPIESNEAKA